MLTPQKKKAKRSLVLISVIAAVFIWFIVGTFINPSDTRYISGVPVQIKDSSVLSALDLSVVEGAEQTVTVKVSGPKLAISTLTAADFTAIPRYSGISDPGVYTLDVDVTLSSGFSGVKVEEYSPNAVSVRLARLGEKTFDIGYAIEAQIPDGRVLGSVALTDTSVTVTGEQSVLDSIASAKVYIYSFDNTVQTLPIVLVNSNGDIVDTSSLTLSISQTQATATLNYIKVINLLAAISDADEYNLGNTVNRTVTPSTLTIVAAKDVIDSMSDSFIVDTVSMSEISGDSQTEIPLKLPAGVTALNGEDSVTVTTTVGSCISKRFDVSRFIIDDSLTSENISITVNTQKISSVKIMGDANVIEAIKAEDLIARVIYTAEETPPKGRCSMTVIITTASGNVWAVGDYTVNVTVN